MSDEEEYEQILCMIKECFVYKIPPRHAASGYRASEWDVSSFIWSGKLQVVSKGNNCLIKLIDTTTGDLFATCPYTPTSVEPVSDSSRYFVLRIDNGTGKHAFVGMGFTERSEAFDFNAALQDHNKYVKQRKEESTSVQRLEQQPKLDFSLGEGQTFKVNIKTVNKTNSNPTPKPTSIGGFLPPPPTSVTTKKPTTQQKSTDPWSDFTDFTSSSSNTNQSKSNNDWITFG